MDFGGGSFQNVSGPPTSLRGAAPGFPGTSNRPGASIAEPAILRDTPGRRSNATVQYHRIVPMGSRAQEAETAGLRQGVLGFTYNDRMNNTNRAPSGQGVEKLSHLVAWDYLVQKIDRATDGGVDGSVPVRNPPDVSGTDDVQRVQRLTNYCKVRLREDDIKNFELDMSPQSFSASPFLMWKDWKDSNLYKKTNQVEIRTAGDTSKLKKEPLQYDDFERVQKLWDLILLDKKDSSGLLSEDCMGRYKPDGFVLYKFATEGGDQLAETMLDANQHGVFNVVVSGHAMATSWAQFDPDTKQSRRLLTLPRDVLYVAIKGQWIHKKTAKDQLDDAITDNKKAKGEENDAKTTLESKRSAYENTGSDTALREMIDAKKVHDKTIMDVGSTTTRYNDMTQLFNSAPCFHSFQLIRTTSNELNGTSTTSRLKSWLRENEVILGAWRIGSVIDSAASRAIPAGGLSASSNPTTMGLTVSVAIRWVSSYMLHDLHFAGGKVLDPAAGAAAASAAASATAPAAASATAPATAPAAASDEALRPGGKGGGSAIPASSRGGK